MVTAACWMKLAGFTSCPAGLRTHGAQGHVDLVHVKPFRMLVQLLSLRGHSCHEARGPAEALEMDLLEGASRPSCSFHRPALGFGGSRSLSSALSPWALRGGGTGEQQVAEQRASAVQGAQGGRRWGRPLGNLFNVYFPL